MQQDLLEACSHGFLDPIPRVSDSGEELGLLREGAKGDEGRHLLSRKEHQAHFSPLAMEEQFLPEQK